MIALLLAACLRIHPDPLAEEREALSGLAAAPIEANWPAQASLVLSQALIADGLAGVLFSPLDGPSDQTTMMGSLITATPQIHERTLALQASDECDSCLQASISLVGSHRIVKENSTGTSNSVVSWELLLGVLLEVGLDDSGRLVQVQPASLEHWTTSLSVDTFPGTWRDELSVMIEEGMRHQLGDRDLPVVTVAQLRDGGPVGLRGLRVRPGANGSIVVDYAFDVVNSGRVEQLPVVETGWTVVAPEQTLLAILQAAAIRNPIAGVPVIPKFTNLVIHDNQLQTDLSLWPMRGRPPLTPRTVAVTMSPSVVEGGVDISMVDTEFGDDTDLVSQLLETRVMDVLASHLSVVIPDPDPDPGPGAVEAAAQIRVQDGFLIIEGSFSNSADDLEAPPASPQ